jgi:hypothetical protein
MTIYGTAAGFREYHTARGVDVSAYDDDAAIEAKLLVASEWLDNTYRSLFKGWKVGTRDVQDREWPRNSVYDNEGNAVSSASVPVEVDNATYEAALRELQSSGTLTKDFIPNKYKRVAIAGSVSVDYAGSSQSSDVQTQLTIVSQILDPLLGGNAYAAALSGSLGRA